MSRSICLKIVVTMTILLSGFFVLSCNVQPVKSEPKTWTVDDDGSIDRSISTSSFPENGAVSITFDDGPRSQYDHAWPLLQARGMTATFYVISDYIRDLSGNSSYLSIAELQSLYDSGCEIASHSKTHPSFSSLSDSQIVRECTESKQALQSCGFTVNNFAYPYGERNDHTDSIVSQYYRSGRSAYDRSYIMQLPISQFRLLATAGSSQTSFSELKEYVDNVMASKGWAIIVFHSVVPEITGNWQTSTQVFSDFLDYLVSNNVTVLTVNQALNAIDRSKISIFSRSSTNLVGFKVIINGTLTDSRDNGISGANIIISYTFPDISEWIPFSSATTDFQGNYYSRWIPPATGNFILKAEWAGTQIYTATNQSIALDIIPYKDEYVFSVASNSTISTLMFNSTSQELEFDAAGPQDTTGYAQVTTARTLVDDAARLKLYLDGTPLAYSTSSTDDSWIVSFTYAHSTHHIKLDLNPRRLQGDIDNDGKVDIVDLSIVATAFRSRPEDERWNPTADLDNNGIVDIVDIAIVAREYGKQV